jgi:hypothetical protein
MRAGSCAPRMPGNAAASGDAAHRRQTARIVLVILSLEQPAAVRNPAQSCRGPAPPSDRWVSSSRATRYPPLALRRVCAVAARASAPLTSSPCSSEVWWLLHDSHLQYTSIARIGARLRLIAGCAAPRHQCPRTRIVAIRPAAPRRMPGGQRSTTSRCTPPRGQGWRCAPPAAPVAGVAHRLQKAAASDRGGSRMGDRARQHSAERPAYTRSMRTLKGPRDSPRPAAVPQGRPGPAHRSGCRQTRRGTDRRWCARPSAPDGRPPDRRALPSAAA